MKADKARDYVIFGLLLWLLYKRQQTTVDVHLTDVGGNPVDSTPQSPTVSGGGSPTDLPYALRNIQYRPYDINDPFLNPNYPLHPSSDCIPGTVQEGFICAQDWFGNTGWWNLAGQ